MNPEPRDPLIQRAERVAAVASEIGMPTALIGATALAAHNYVRGTADIDPHLIALKLFAGSRRDQADVVELLRRNPGADRSQVREVCARYGFEQILEELIAEV